MFTTEIDFTLPCGYLDPDGAVHRHGVMRRATAADEILPLQDPRVARNPAYLVVILLSRVITRLGGVPEVTPRVIEALYASDLAYLQRLYGEVNDLEANDTPVTCPQCQHAFVPEERPLGESVATP